MTTTTKASLVEPWKTSQAKHLLQEDILSGKVTIGMKAEEIYEMRVEYKNYKLRSFKINLKNLQASILKLYEAAETASQGYENYLRDCKANPTPSSSRGYPKWDGSEAARFRQTCP
jgi:hypothetical protein